MRPGQHSQFDFFKMKTENKNTANRSSRINIRNDALLCPLESLVTLRNQIIRYIIIETHFLPCCVDGSKFVALFLSCKQ